MSTDVGQVQILDVRNVISDVEPDCLVGRMVMTRYLMWEIGWRADGEYQGLTDPSRRRALAMARRRGVLAVIEQTEGGECLTVLTSRRKWSRYCATHPEWSGRQTVPWLWSRILMRLG